MSLYTGLLSSLLKLTTYSYTYCLLLPFTLTLTLTLRFISSMPSKTINFTPEFIKACEDLWRDGFNKGINGDDNHPDFKSFFSLADDKSEQSLEEKANLPFNPHKCEARTEQYGYAIQCTRSKFGDGCLCKTHQNMLDKFGAIRYGRFNEPRPENNLITNDPIKWGAKKTRVNKTQKKDTTTPKLKVGEMRDYLSSRVPVDDFRGLKKAELTELYLKVKDKENASSSSDEENTPISNSQPEDNSEQSEQPKHSEQSERGDNTEQKDLRGQIGGSENEENNHSEKEGDGNSDEISDEISQGKNSPSSEKVEDDATGVGFHLQPSVPTTLSGYKSLFKELSIDTDGLRGMRAYKEAYESYLKEKEEAEEGEKTQPMSDDEDDIDDLQEDKNSYEEMTFEGVSYLEDEDSGKIYNLKHQHVGKWNEDVDDIIWSSEEFKSLHESSRQ